MYKWWAGPITPQPTVKRPIPWLFYSIENYSKLSQPKRIFCRNPTEERTALPVTIRCPSSDYHMQEKSNSFHSDRQRRFWQRCQIEEQEAGNNHNHLTISICVDNTGETLCASTSAKNQFIVSSPRTPISVFPSFRIPESYSNKSATLPVAEGPLRVICAVLSVLHKRQVTRQGFH